MLKKDKIANWTLFNIDKYDEKQLIIIFQKLREIKNNYKDLGINFKNLPNQYMLYNYIKKTCIIFQALLLIGNHYNNKKRSLLFKLRFLL